jgi:hypothetical protein
MHTVGFGVFGLFFVCVFVLVMGTFAVTGFLAYKCYSGGDPNNMACFMISDRHEIGIRNR